MFRRVKRKKAADPPVTCSPTAAGEGQQGSATLQDPTVHGLSCPPGRLHHNSGLSNDLHNVVVVPSRHEPLVLDADLGGRSILERAIVKSCV